MTDEANVNDGLSPADAAVQIHATYAALRRELCKVIVGQDEAIEQLTVCLFARGHALLDCAPGVAKGWLIGSLGKCLGLSSMRIQFTPDLLPSDITGSGALPADAVTGQRKLQRGPLFSNLIRADDLNLAPPNVQAVLFEAIQERQVIVEEIPRLMEDPFFVLVSQNRIEQGETWPLSDAQRDCFLLEIPIPYPGHEATWKEYRRNLFDATAVLQPVLDAEALVRMQHLVRRIAIADDVLDYALRLVRATQPAEADAPKCVKDHVRCGAGVRAGQSLVLGGKARAALHGRPHVSTDDVRALARPVFRHRIVIHAAAAAAGVTADNVVEQLLAAPTFAPGSAPPTSPSP
jgi:MoxR-like ATPase